MYHLKEYTELEIPQSDAAISRAIEFAKPIESSWTKGKVFNGIQTYTSWVNSDENTSQFWAGRVSYHTDITYEELHDTLYDNHTENEAEYIGMIQSFKELDKPASGDWISWLVSYKLPLFMGDRDMTIWLTQKETIKGKQFVNVTIPRSFETNKTKGIYVSVEVVTKLDDGSVQWTMATTSDAGGLIPQFIQRMKMTDAVAADIPQFQKWLDVRRKKDSPLSTNASASA